MIARSLICRVFGLLVLLHAAGVHRVAAAPPQLPGKPNIVLIMADDLGYGSLGCYGSVQVKTPHIDQLAMQGIRLTDFHSNGAYCSPTRAALMTGRYQQRCAWVPDEELSPVFREQRLANQKQRWAWGISRHEITLPSLLQKSGYRTALVGKWHLGYDEAFHPMNFGFDEFRGFIGGNVDYHTHSAGSGRKELDWWNDRNIANQQGYTTDLLTRSATDFIARHKDAPFFLYLAHAAPHEPWQGRHPAIRKSPAAIYQEMIGVLDESVGTVLRALRENDLESRTLVIFCSDNGPDAPKGFAANASLKGKKGSLHEGGHRVPCIVRWPGVLPAGETNGNTVITMDFLPTIAAIAGASVPSGHIIDGMDFLPLMRRNHQASGRLLHWHSDSSWAVRRGAWKLIGSADTPVFLANLDASPDEAINHLAQQPDLARELLTAHRTWIGQVGSK